MNSFKKLGLAVVAAALTACGGGGDNTSTGSASAPSNTATSGGSSAISTGTGTLANSVPAPNYAAGSTEMGMFNQLNDVRLKGGFGMLAQDPMLDKASTNHAKYNISNWFTSPMTWSSGMGQIDAATGYLSAHIENPNKLGFTGIKSSDRVTAAGGSFAGTSEVVANTPDCLGSLLNTVFHRDTLLSTDFQKLGIGYVLTPGNQSVSCVMNPGFISKPSTRPDNWIGVYPGVSQLGVPVAMGGEYPDPAPDVTTKGAPITIYLNSALGAVQSFTLKATGATQTVPVRVLTYKDFPKYLSQRVAHILPTAPLAYDTTYTVDFVGTLNDGSTVKKTWSFTTTPMLPITIKVSSTVLKAEAPVTATISGGTGWKNLYAYSSYQYYGSNTKPTFGEISYINPASLTVTRNTTQCTPGVLVNCVVVIVGVDQAGQKSTVTIPVQ